MPGGSSSRAISMTGADWAGVRILVTISSWRWSFEATSILLEVSDVPERLALLLASSHGARGIPEGKDGQHVEAVRDVEQRSGALQASEADPVRAHPIAPPGQQHRLDRTARVGDGEPAPIGHYHDRQRRLGHVRAARRQGAEPAQRIALPDPDEVPGLPVHPPARQASRLADAA